MGRHSVWELVFLMLILKIPIVYICLVVVHAIRAEPSPEEGAAVTARLGTDDPGSGWSRGLRTRRFRPRPHGGPSRTYSRSPRTAVACAEANRR
ncbi:MAG TPA: hypothetical protein VIL98_10400 [Gaiellaceae bacterium]